MNAMIDVQCKCGKRFGWAGRMANRPACPRCGDRPPQAELEEADRRMDADRELFLTHPMKATLDQLRQQRVAAGLTLRQAAKLLNISLSELSDYEFGRRHLEPAFAERMAKVYGVEASDG